jgi:apolipoprotein N-acyltransferase
VRLEAFRDVIALLAGAVYALGFAPFPAGPWVAPLALAVLFHSWLDVSHGAAFRRGLLFGIGAFATGVSWVYVSLHDYGQMPAGLAVVSVAGLVVFLALYPAAAGVLQAFARALNHPVRLVVVMPGCWVLLDWLRGWLFSGFPWLSVGYSQIDGWLGGFAPFVGVYGVSVAAAILSGVAVALLGAGGRRRWLMALVSIGVIGGGWAAGRIDHARPVGDPVALALVQENVPLSRKWLPNAVDTIADGYLEASRDSAADLIIWPEAAIPRYLDQIDRSFLDALRAHPADFLIGVLERRRVNGEIAYYNSALGIAPDRYAIYRKQHLVPFGEFLPLRPLFSWVLEFLNIPMSDFTAWTPAQSPMTLNKTPMAVSICYEDAFADEVRRAAAGAQILVNISEDAWFGDSLAPHQRLQMARMRALENARPLARVSNTGLSGVIDHRGEIRALSKQFTAQVLESDIQPVAGLTPYTRYGNRPVVVLLMLALAISFAWAWHLRQQVRP